MKKLVSVILATILVAGAMVTVGAYGPYPVQEELVYQFEDKFVERFSATYDQIENLYVYDELYYHYDENGQIDWCLISAKPNTDFETADIKYLKFNDFVLHSNSTNSFFFEMQYGIYDVDADAFMSIVDCYYKLDKYEEAVDALRGVPYSRPIGDYDDDNRLSILDATGIQRMLAKLDDLRCDGYHDKFGNMGDFADFDGDREISILDATAIQRKLAQLDSEPVEPTQDATVVPTVEPTEFSTTPDPFVSGTENPNEIHLYFPDPKDSLYCKGNVYSEYMGADGNVYCRILDMDFNTIGDSDLYSQEHLAEIVVQEKNKIGVYYYPLLKGLELEPGAYMYDFYTTEKALIFRSYLYID